MLANECQTFNNQLNSYFTFCFYLIIYSIFCSVLSSIIVLALFFVYNHYIFLKEKLDKIFFVRRKIIMVGECHI